MSLRFARCVTSSARSALTSGTAKVFSSRLSTHECIPPSECSHPSAGEYVDLVASAPVPSTESAFDIGTGTGVLAAVLAQRGVKAVTATDQDPPGTAMRS